VQRETKVHKIRGKIFLFAYWIRKQGGGERGGNLENERCEGSSTKRELASR
jgi:hypothetical protein